MGLTDILNVASTLIDRLIPDPKERAEAKLKLAELEQSGELQLIAGQVEIDKIEAASPDRFIAGWRPFVGWICAAGLGVQYVAGPLLGWLCSLFGRNVPVPSLNIESLTTLLIGLLGLGTLRTVEKLKGVTK